METPSSADLSSINSCDHLFCFSCIGEWAEHENSCPLCKKRFEKITRVSEDGKKRKRSKEDSGSMTKTVKQRSQHTTSGPTGVQIMDMLMNIAGRSGGFPGFPGMPSRGGGGGGRGGPNPAASALFRVVAGSAARRGAIDPYQDMGSDYDDDYDYDDDDDDDMHGFPFPAGMNIAQLLGPPPLGLIQSIMATRERRLGASPRGPPARNFASNASDANAGTATNALEIEDSDSEERSPPPPRRAAGARGSTRGSGSSAAAAAAASSGEVICLDSDDDSPASGSANTTTTTTTTTTMTETSSPASRGGASSRPARARRS
jgi:hypothetical protein